MTMTKTNSHTPPAMTTTSNTLINFHEHVMINHTRWSFLIGLCALCVVSFSTLPLHAAGNQTSDQPQTRQAKPPESPQAGSDESESSDADQTLNNQGPKADRPSADAAHNADQRRRNRKGNSSSSELSEADMPDALAVLHDYRPELVKRFEDWASRHPENARVMLSNSVPMMQRLIRMRREDPAGYRLAIEDLRYYRFTAQLSKQLREATTQKDHAAIDDLSDKLRTLLIRHFEIRQKIREREIEKLQSRIDQLRDQLKHRTDARDEILSSRFKQLSDPDEKTPW